MSGASFNSELVNFYKALGACNFCAGTLDATQDAEPRRELSTIYTENMAALAVCVDLLAQAVHRAAEAIASANCEV